MIPRGSIISRNKEAFFKFNVFLALKKIEKNSKYVLKFDEVYNDIREILKDCVNRQTPVHEFHGIFVSEFHLKNMFVVTQDDDEICILETTDFGFHMRNYIETITDNKSFGNLFTIDRKTFINEAHLIAFDPLNESELKIIKDEVERLTPNYYPMYCITLECPHEQIYIRAKSEKHLMEKLEQSYQCKDRQILNIIHLPDKKRVATRPKKAPKLFSVYSVDVIVNGIEITTGVRVTKTENKEIVLDEIKSRVKQVFGEKATILSYYKQKGVQHGRSLNLKSSTYNHNLSLEDNTLLKSIKERFRLDTLLPCDEVEIIK